MWVRRWRRWLNNKNPNREMWGKTRQSECKPLLHTQYGSQMCDTFAHSEMSITKLTYLTMGLYIVCQKCCKVCPFWSECDKIIVQYKAKWVITPTAHPVWEPNVWYIRTLWDERLKIDTPYSVTAPWVSQVCNCRQLFSECVKFIAKNKAKSVMNPTARPVWENFCPNVSNSL